MSVNNSPQFRWKTFQKYTHTHMFEYVCVRTKRVYTHAHTHGHTKHEREKMWQMFTIQEPRRMIHVYSLY